MKISTTPFTRILLIIALAAALTATHSTANVTIPDPGLEQALRDHLRLEPTDPITETALNRITSYLNASNRDIINLTGLEYCTNLRGLRLFKNQIRDLTPLSELTNLELLHFGGNQISDLTPLSGLTRLEELNLAGNQITDITPLSGLIWLEDLGLDGNQITDITPLKELPNLTVLWMRENHISNLRPLQDLIRLEAIYLTNNCISDLSPLLELPVLERLDVDYNPLSGTQIATQINQLTDKDVEVEFSTYSELYCTGNVVEEVEGEASSSCGCGKDDKINFSPDGIKRLLGDWLIIGLSLSVLLSLGVMGKKA